MADLYVDTDAANDSGDGSVGSPKKWLRSAVALLPASLVTATTSYVIHCKGATAETVAVVINNTTNATYTLTVQVDQANRHAGVYSASFYRLEVSGEAVVYIGSDYLHFDGLQFRLTHTSEPYVIGLSANATWRGTVSNCIIVGNFSGTAGSGNGNGIYAPGGAISVKNCIVYDWINGSTGYNIGGCLVDAATATLYNNTFHHCFIGLYVGWSGPVFTNNLAQSCTTCYAGGNYSASALTNISEDTSSPNAAFRSKVVVFVDEGGDNFLLDGSDTEARDKGTDLSGIFTTDIRGQTRTGTWDIGADEYVAAGGAPDSNLIVRRRMVPWFTHLRR